MDGAKRRARATPVLVERPEVKEVHHEAQESKRRSPTLSSARLKRGMDVASETIVKIGRQTAHGG
jgi:hypothetical protein